MINANDLHAWDEGLHQPMGVESLHESVMAAIYGYKFNDDYDLTTRVFQNPCSVGWNSCTIPRVEADHLHYPSDDVELAAH